MKWTAALGLIAVVAGCLDTDAGSPGPDAAPRGPVAEGTECQATSTWTQHAADSFPPYPAPWAAEKATGARALDVLSCTRVSMGTLERGPVFLVLEYHDHYRQPGPCAESDGPQHRFVGHSVLVDDREIADAMATAFSIGVSVAQGRLDRTDTGGWSMGWVAEGQRSWIQVPAAAGVASAVRDTSHRYYWPGTDGTSGIDMARMERTADILHPPSLVDAESPHIRSPPGPPLAGETFVGSMSFTMEARQWPGPAC